MSYYRSFDPPAGVQPASELPSEKRMDLLLGVPLYGVEAEAPIAENFRTAHFNTPDDAYTLTNGVMHAVLDYKDPAFTHFTGGTGRSIYYKLANLSAVKGFAANFLYQHEVGIHLPYRFDIFLSENGTEWQCVYRKRGFSHEANPSIVCINADFGCAYRACWVRFDMDVHDHMWIESLSLYGCTALDGAFAVAKDSTASAEDPRIFNRYPTYDELSGVHNVFLAYNCMPPEYDKNGIGAFTAEDMLPYLGYVKDGKILDTFFDSVLFLPFARFTYSKFYKSAEGWRYYIDNTFGESKNVDAVDQAAGKVGEALGIENRVKIFLSIFHTKPGYGEFPETFGDLDGDGIDEDLTTFEGRKKATKWLIDTQLARYTEKERPNTELIGFYWFEEEISYNDPMELKLLAYVSDYVHGMGYRLIWIPYYQAWGYDNWKQNGFDVACIQPNYAFQKEATRQRLYDNAALAKKFGLCFELEIAGVGNPADIDRYKEYLEVGVETGFMHTVKMYYQGGRDFLTAFRSEDQLVRSVYDDTYLFAKEKLVKPYRE